MSDLVPYQDLERMASQVVKSRMFPGIATPESAITLMLLCQSEGLHPMQAMTRYHIIQNRPAMKADAMLAEFMRRGGTVKWIEWTNEACEAEFKSTGCPEGIKVRWAMDDAKRAGVTGNPTWSKYPRQMLKARVASDGVRMADPAVNQGRYTPEEVRDFDDEPKTEQIEAEVVGTERLKDLDAEGKTTDEMLEGAAKNRAEAVAKYVDDGPTDSGGESIFDKLDKAKADVAAKVAKENVARECPKCGIAVHTFTVESGNMKGRTYWECHTRHVERHEGKKRGDSTAVIKGRAEGHYFKGSWEK